MAAAACAWTSSRPAWAHLVGGEGREAQMSAEFPHVFEGHGSTWQCLTGDSDGCSPVVRESAAPSAEQRAPPGIKRTADLLPAVGQGVYMVRQLRQAADVQAEGIFCSTGLGMPVNTGEGI